MKTEIIKYGLRYGLGIWLGLVVASLLLAPIETANSPLFESLKSVALATIVVCFMALFLKKAKQATPAQGVIIGVIWALITIALDSLLYALGLFGNFTFNQYCNDVASSYTIMPVLGGVMAGFLKSR